MKQFFTLEDDLTIITEFLSEMIKNEYISSQQAQEILDAFSQIQEDDHIASKPGNDVINRILNYSKSVDTLKSKKTVYNLVGN
jgi:hypothetical protein